MKRHILAALCAVAGSAVSAADVSPEDVVFTNGAVEASLSGAPGDPAVGEKIMNKGAGNCVACHSVTVLAEKYLFHGNVGPSLDGVAERWNEAELRGIVTNAKNTFDGTVMPSFYKTSGYIRPGDAYTGKAPKEALSTLLTAQEIEDVVAYLMTLK